MAQVSDWSTLEQNNVTLDDLTLSGEGGLYTNKIMCAVRKKFDDVDGKLASVQGAYVFKGVKADMTALEAVEDPAVGDVYSVTALGGANFAWDGTAWDDLGTSDANVVHKTGAESVDGEKTFLESVYINNMLRLTKTGALVRTSNDNGQTICGGTTNTTTGGAYAILGGISATDYPGCVRIYTGKIDDSYGFLLGKPDGTLTWSGQPIQTSSDERLKTALAAVPDAVLDAWGDVQWGQFRYLAAIATKGADAARQHPGLIAQRVKDAFEARGLDACEYGILCHETHAESDGTPATDMWMVRYTEALAMEAAYQRRRADRLESRIQALEARLDGND